MAKPDVEEPQPDRLVGVEARKLYAAKLRDGFIGKYLSGTAILDIGYRGYEPDVVPIVPRAIGIDLDYPGYDGLTLPFPDDSQDAVFSSHCLEHAEDCRATITEWFRVLKAGGFLVIAVPHKYLYERRVRPPSRWNLDHRRFFTPATLLLRIEEALAPNAYRVRHLADNDVAYGYSIPTDSHPGGCYEIELVIEKIAVPPWALEDPSLNERKSVVIPLPLQSTPTKETADQPPTRRDKIYYDGLNLALTKGTGIATYTRLLTRISSGLGYDVGVVYETGFDAPDNAILQDVLFFDRPGAGRQRKKEGLASRIAGTLTQRLMRHGALRPSPIKLGNAVDTGKFAGCLSAEHQAFICRDIFNKSKIHFARSGKCLEISFAEYPNIFHLTYPVPIISKKSCNIFTIHDLVPLRLPYATLDDKKKFFDMAKFIAKTADHIVTVSEASKRDIMKLLGIEDKRITNTYQAANFVSGDIERSEESVANFVSGACDVEMHGYFLFFGALEPKKNVGRLVDAYLSSGVEQPLVLVTGPGWQSEDELRRINALEARTRTTGGKGSKIRRMDYMARSSLVNLIRGARAVIFPSLLEGFGLPVLEAMTLGTPVITSSVGALAEVAGDAAILVDPYDVDDIARAIKVVAQDADLCGELSQKGLMQADKFSLARYRERVRTLYASLA